MMETRNPWARRLAWALGALTLALISAGGLVTGTHSGLAVPDWPLSFGRLWPPMVGGIFYEHGHRTVGALAGLLTLLLNAAVRRERPAVRRTAAAALLLVVVQGVLGGATVLLGLSRPVSVLHAVLAPTFFSLAAALAALTGPWTPPEAPPRRTEGVPLRHLAFLLAFTAWLQILLGAVIRHAGLAVGAHIVNAVVLAGLVGVLLQRLVREHAADRELWRSVLVLGAGVGLQCVLGLIVLADALWRLIPDGGARVLVGTAHVVLGAGLLGLCVRFFVLTLRRDPSPWNWGRPADYLRLTKPGISVMAAVTALAGFLLASQGRFEPGRWLHTAVGTLLVSAGACALNMLMEREVDARMRRTRLRPLPSRRLLPGEALLLGILLLAAGLVYLAARTNPTTAWLAGLAAALYLYVYTPLKKRSSLNTAVGAVAGAIPPVLGWAAASGRVDPGAWVLFAVLFFWQFPHFFSLAWLYREDYARAGLAMLPVGDPDGRRTTRHILGGAGALVAASAVPVALGWGGGAYAVVAAGLGAVLLASAAAFARERSEPAARRLFRTSLVYLPVLLTVLVAWGPRGG